MVTGGRLKLHVLVSLCVQGVADISSTSDLELKHKHKGARGTCAGAINSLRSTSTALSEMQWVSYWCEREDQEQPLLQMQISPWKPWARPLLNVSLARWVFFVR